MKRTVASGGEFGLIRGIRNRLSLPGSVVQGPGDDCAVVKHSPLTYELLTCDMLVEGVDFTARDDPFLVGRKAVAVSLSDIASCAGVPRYCLVSAGLAPSFPRRSFDRLTRGMLSCLRTFNTSLIGGDISRADKLTLNVAMTGVVEKKNLVLRSGAAEGDFIFVTGPLGGTIKGKHLDFTPRVREARLLVKACKLHAMIDISDGLCQDLGHIMEESEVGAVLYERLIPVRDDARDLPDALYGGEDFELLFTVSKRDAKRLLQRSPVRVHPVGEITARRQGLRLVDLRGRERRIAARGWRHF